MTRTPFSMLDVLDARMTCATSAGKIAIVDGDRRITYGELADHVRRVASALRQHNVRKGDRVGIFLRRSVELVAALFATWRSGAPDP